MASTSEVVVIDKDKKKAKYDIHAKDSEKLGGQAPEYYAPKTEVDKKANDDDVVKKATGLPSSLTLEMNGSSSVYRGTSAVSKTWYAPTHVGKKGEILTSNGTGEPAWMRECRPIIIAANDAGSEIKERADFICDGTADEEQLILAAAKIGSWGGRIELSEGTFIISSSVNIENENIMLFGQGTNTILQRAFTSSTQYEGMITLNGNCRIKNMYFDGDRRPKNYGSCIELVSSHNIVENVMCKNYAVAVAARGSYNFVQKSYFTEGYSTSTYCSILAFTNTSEKNIISDNVIADNSVNGASISCNGTDNCVRNNIITGNMRAGISAYGKYHSFVGNSISDNNGYGIELNANSCNSVVGNSIFNNKAWGIYLNSSNDNTITGNLSIDNKHDDIGGGGICIHGSRNVVDANNCISGTGTTSDYGDTIYTIRVGSSSRNNLVTNNQILGKDYVNEGGATNTFINNKYQ